MFGRDKRKGLFAAYRKLGPFGRFMFLVTIISIILGIVYFVIQMIVGATKKGQKDAREDMNFKHKQEMKYLELIPKIASDVTDVKQGILDENKEKNRIYYEISEIEHRRDEYYRTIRIKNNSEKFSQYNFVVEIKADEVFLENVNGPRPIGGGPIDYIAPYVYDNICEISIVELKPKQTILVGLTSNKKWNLISITGYRRQY